jgi:hypothetical protein
MVVEEDARVTAVGDREVTVTVQNTNILIPRTFTIWYEVTTEQGNIYQQSMIVALDPYERGSFVLEIDLPVSEHLSSWSYRVYLS